MMTAREREAKYNDYDNDDNERRKEILFDYMKIRTITMRIAIPTMMIIKN